MQAPHADDLETHTSSTQAAAQQQPSSLHPLPSELRQAIYDERAAIASNEQLSGADQQKLLDRQWDKAEEARDHLEFIKTKETNATPKE